MTAVLLYALSAASLGCAIAACFAVPDAPPPATPPAAVAPTPQSMADFGAPRRCAGSLSTRVRRAGLCRVTDLAAV